MKYLIAHLLSGEAKEWHIALSRRIAERFDTPRIDERFPPHVTLVYPFEIDDVSPIEELLAKWGAHHESRGRVVISDYGLFPERAVYAAVTLNEEVKRRAEQLKGEAFALVVPDKKFLEWIPHATLAFELAPEKIREIWEYVKDLPKPEFSMPFDNVALLSLGDDGKWRVYTNFPLK